MALTPFQRQVCRALADRRRARGESDVAGGVALGVALGAQRLSRALDLFHDTREAVSVAWEADRRLLEADGFGVEPVHERPGLVEAIVVRGDQSLVVEWAQASAFRFFPLVEHPELGLTLHPFDLATNKVLALVGRLEVRDWVDVLICHERLQPLGYLAWAACGKDPGFTPPGLLAHARRTARYSESEVATLAFEGAAPDASALSRLWKDAVGEAEALVDVLPPAHAGAAVLEADGTPCRRGRNDLARALADAHMVFHHGRIGGAWPTVKNVSP